MSHASASCFDVSPQTAIRSKQTLHPCSAGMRSVRECMRPTSMSNSFFALSKMMDKFRGRHLSTPIDSINGLILMNDQLWELAAYVSQSSGRRTVAVGDGEGEGLYEEALAPAIRGEKARRNSSAVYVRPCLSRTVRYNPCRPVGTLRPGPSNHNTILQSGLPFTILVRRVHHRGLVTRVR